MKYNDISNVKTRILSGVQYRPNSIEYNKNCWNQVQWCSKCESIGSRYDLLLICPQCGARNTQPGSGFWIRPKYEWRWLYRKKIKDGYWLLKDDERV